MSRKTKAKGKEAKKCRIEGCEELARWSELCPACWMGMKYWMRKTPGDVIRRQKQLYRLSNRMEQISSNVRRK